MGLTTAFKTKLLLHAINHNRLMQNQWANKVSTAKTEQRKSLCLRMAAAYKEIADVLTEYGEID